METIGTGQSKQSLEETRTNKISITVSSILTVPKNAKKAKTSETRAFKSSTSLRYVSFPVGS